MDFRRGIALWAIGAAAGLGCLACSSGGLRDQYYGTDVGATDAAAERVDQPPNGSG